MVKDAINIKLRKTGLDIVLELKVAPEIEDYFRRVSANSFETSSKWLDEDGEGLEFYKKNEKMSGRVAGTEVIDNFGNGLFENNLINVALLRTVGASNGITIQTHDLLSYEEMKTYIQALGVWTRGFYENVLQPAEVDGTIEFKF